MTATGFVGGYAGAYIENALKPFGIKSAFYHVAAEKMCIRDSKYSYSGTN